MTVASAEQLNNNRNNRIKQQEDCKGKLHGKIFAGLYANSNHLARCIGGGGGGGDGGGGGSVRPLADVFLRGIGSIPDRFSNESRGLNAERTRARALARGTRADMAESEGNGRVHRDQRVGHPPRSWGQLK